MLCDLFTVEISASSISLILNVNLRNNKLLRKQTGSAQPVGYQFHKAWSSGLPTVSQSRLWRKWNMKMPVIWLLLSPRLTPKFHLYKVYCRPTPWPTLSDRIIIVIRWLPVSFLLFSEHTFSELETSISANRTCWQMIVWLCHVRDWNKQVLCSMSFCFLSLDSHSWWNCRC